MSTVVWNGPKSGKTLWHGTYKFYESSADLFPIKHRTFLNCLIQYCSLYHLTKWYMFGIVYMQRTASGLLVYRSSRQWIYPFPPHRHPSSYEKYTKSLNKILFLSISSSFHHHHHTSFLTYKKRRLQAHIASGCKDLVLNQ